MENITENIIAVIIFVIPTLAILTYAVLSFFPKSTRIRQKIDAFRAAYVKRKEENKAAAEKINWAPLTETEQVVLTIFLILLGFAAFAAITFFFGIVVALLVTIIVLIIGHIGRGF